MSSSPSFGYLDSDLAVSDFFVIHAFLWVDLIDYSAGFLSCHGVDAIC